MSDTDYEKEALKWLGEEGAITKQTLGVLLKNTAAQARKEAFEEAARTLDNMPSNPRYLGELFRGKAAQEKV